MGWLGNLFKNGSADKKEQKQKKNPPGGKSATSSASAGRKKTPPSSAYDSATGKGRKGSHGTNGNTQARRRSPAGGPGKSRIPAARSNNKNVPTRAPAKNSKTRKTRPTLAQKPQNRLTVKVGPAKIPEEFKHADPSKFKLSKHTFSGSCAFQKCGKEETVQGSSIVQGQKLFQAHPKKYAAMKYQTAMLQWPENQQAFTLIHRDGTLGYKPHNVSPKGWMTMLLQEYRPLRPLKDNLLPIKFRDKYTDSMTFQGRTIHSAKNKPLLPGRGMGVGDSPSLKIIGDVDPSDIFQGSVGDCWLLSGISALAEFDGAVKKLFRKNKNLHQKPLDGPNTYIVTLWDLPTWREVDIVIDERLPAMPDGSGRLLASRPSEDGELWVPYLEKALAIHCGGWDKIQGGQCTHAWALLTGCKEQYNIRMNPKTKRFACYAKYNPHQGAWSKHYNCPHDGNTSLWRVPWPKVGGGGDETLELTRDELFKRMCIWDQHNFIVGAGTNGKSDKHSTGGIVDNHAYTVIEAHSNVAGTKIDLLKVRNPWGNGEIEDGMFGDDGPGWDRYPQIKRLLKPVVADDGIFWVTKEEFFQFYGSIYLSASNMTLFLED